MHKRLFGRHATTQSLSGNTRIGYMTALAPTPLTLPLPRIREILAAHYRRLGEASRTLRFMGPIKGEAMDRVAGKASPHLVLAIEADGATRGLLELFTTREPGHAEIGLSVEDAYQGLGYGRALFHRGIEEARRGGFETVDVQFSTRNAAIAKLCRDEGGSIRVAGEDSASLIPLT